MAKRPFLVTIEKAFWKEKQFKVQAQSIVEAERMAEELAAEYNWDSVKTMTECQTAALYTANIVDVNKEVKK